MEIALRIGAAALVGLTVGMERERHGRAAGLRTTMLASVAAAVIMMISERLRVTYLPSSAGWGPDPARLAAGALTGIGFLGAGAILREGNRVRGVTTAATLWFVTILGLAFGAGQWRLGAMGWCIGLFVLLILPYVERHIPNDWYGVVTVTAGADRVSIAAIVESLAELHIAVKAVSLDHDRRRDERVFRCDVKYKKMNLPVLAEQTVERLMKLPGVLRAEWS